MTVYVTKINNSFYQTTIEQSVETHTIASNDLTRIALDHDPIDTKQLVAVLYSPQGDRYPDLENYNLYPRNGADFDVIQPYAPTDTTYYFRWLANHLSSERFPAGSTLIISYEYHAVGAEVITNVNAIADAVWDRQRASNVASGSMGEGLSLILGFVDTIPADVWNSLLGDHTVPGTLGKLLNDLVAVSSPSNIANAVWATNIDGVTARAMIEFIYDVEGGRWLLDQNSNQMVLYKADNSTEVARFNFFGADTLPNVVNPYQRRRV